MAGPKIQPRVRTPAKAVDGAAPPAVVEKAKGKQKAKAVEAQAPAPVDTQAIADVAQPAPVETAAQSVPDVVRFVRQSLEQLDRTLLAVPQNQKSGLADGMRGYAEPSGNEAKSALTTANQVFGDIEGAIGALKPEERAQVYGVFHIPYDTSNENGETAKVNVAPPGLNAMNTAQRGANPAVVAGGNMAGVNGGQNGRNRAPVQMPAGNPMMQGAESQDLSDQGPTNPMGLLREVLAQRVQYASYSDTPMYAIIWDDPFGTLGQRPANGEQVQGANTRRDPFEFYDSVPESTLGQQMSGVARKILDDKTINANGFAALAQTLGSDLMRASTWGASATQFMENIRPLLQHVMTSSKLEPGSGVAELKFRRAMLQMGTNPTPQAFMNLAAEIANAPPPQLERAAAPVAAQRGPSADAAMAELDESLGNIFAMRRPGASDFASLKRDAYAAANAQLAAGNGNPYLAVFEALNRALQGQQRSPANAGVSALHDEFQQKAAEQQNRLHETMMNTINNFPR